MGNRIVGTPFVAVINTGGVPPVQSHLHERLTAENKVKELKAIIEKLVPLAEIVLQQFRDEEQHANACIASGIIDNAKDAIK